MPARRLVILTSLMAALAVGGAAVVVLASHGAPGDLSPESTPPTDRSGALFATESGPHPSQFVSNPDRSGSADQNADVTGSVARPVSPRARATHPDRRLARLASAPPDRWLPRAARPNAVASGVADHQPDAGERPIALAPRPLERRSDDGVVITQPDRELAVWFDPQQFAGGTMRIGIADTDGVQAPCVLIVTGGVESARLDGIPLEPGRPYLVEPGMVFAAPESVGVNLRPAKPEEMQPAPNGAG